jgi:hypothetical protein
LQGQFSHTSLVCHSFGLNDEDANQAWKRYSKCEDEAVKRMAFSGPHSFYLLDS